MADSVDCTTSVQTPTGSAAGSVNVAATAVTYGSETATLSDAEIMEYCAVWQSTCDVMQYMNSDYDAQAMGGYALSFDGSSVYTLDLESVGDDVTIEVFIKTSGDGTILSYSSAVNFVLYVEGTVKLMHGAAGDVWDTGLTVTCIDARTPSNRASSLASRPSRSVSGSRHRTTARTPYFRPSSARWTTSACGRG